MESLCKALPQVGIPVHLLRPCSGNKSPTGRQTSRGTTPSAISAVVACLVAVVEKMAALNFEPPSDTHKQPKESFLLGTLAGENGLVPHVLALGEWRFEDLEAQIEICLEV